MKKRMLAMLLSATVFVLNGVAEQASGSVVKPENSAALVRPAQELIQRVLPEHHGLFVCEAIPTEQGKDVFEVDSQNGKVILRGNNGVSIAMAFNWYLRRETLTSYDWQATGPLKLTGVLPMPKAKIRRVCLARERFFFNYCTYGFTFPFTDFAGWQRFYDWMAMNGINRPLMQCGQEAVWLRVWKEYGLSEADICAYFTGPADLPWNRMSNIDHFGGPLPMSYINGQMELQKKLVAYARALGMQPVLSGFAGHVPEKLKTLRPDLKISRIKAGVEEQICWCNFSVDDACWFLDPMDPLFTEIQGRFIKAQTELYGTDHRYAADPFNEISPPSWEPSYIANVARRIYDGMAKADPEAIWYQMGWCIDFDKHWHEKSKDGETPLRAMLAAVPRDRMVMLDYWCEYVEYYWRTENFYGTSFIWNFLGNFGANTYFNAPLQQMAKKIEKALAVPNCVGVGDVLEGLDCNPEAHEMVMEQPWHPGGAIDTKEWIADYAARRAGCRDPRVIEAWQITLDRVLKGGGSKGLKWAAVTWRPPALKTPKGPRPPKTALAGEVHARSPEILRGMVAALDLLFQASPESQKADGYRYDVVNFVRQSLSYYSDDVKARMLDADKRNDQEDLTKQAKVMLGIVRDMEELTATRHEFLLGPWIRDARVWGATPAEADYYEVSARRIITAWGGGMRDYAHREWNGLMRDYYLPRWWNWAKIHAPDAVKGETAPGPKTDFVVQKNGGYITEPVGDPVEVAQRLFKKYRAEFGK